MGKWDHLLWTVICYIEVHFKAGLTVPWYLLHILKSQLKGVHHENIKVPYTYFYYFFREISLKPQEFFFNHKVALPSTIKIAFCMILIQNRKGFAY